MLDRLARGQGANESPAVWPGSRGMGLGSVQLPLGVAGSQGGKEMRAHGK